MSSLIQIKNTAISGSTPANLAPGELAINVTDGRLFYGSGSANFVKEFTGSGGGGSTISASYATTASYVNVLNQNVQISGSLKLDPTQDPDPLGLDLDSTSLFQSSSNTSLGYDLYIRQNGNLVKWKWFEGLLETGLLYGGVVTYSGSNVYVSPGSGIVSEHNATTGSEISPIVSYVTWNAITQSITNIATQQVTYLYIDQTGSLQQQSSRFTTQQYHDYIPLGAVGHFDYTQVSAFGGAVQTAYDQGSQTSNFIDAFGPLKVSGYGLTGQAGSLRLSVGSGTSFIHGGFYQNDPEFPSQITTSAQATASLAYVYRSGSGVQFDTNAGNLYTSLRPGFYDPGTGITGSVSNNDWTIQRVYSDPKTGVLYIYYGQNIYPDYLTAVADLSTDSFTEGDTFDFTTFIGFAIVKSNTTDITDTTDNKIVPAGLFRGSGQGSGGGIALSNLDDLTDVSITSPVDGQALVYNSGIWQNGNPTSASFASTASFLNSTTNAFIQNGNSFGSTALLGTNDNQSLALETSGSTRMFISSNGSIGIGTITPTYGLEIQRNSNTLTGIRILNTTNNNTLNLLAQNNDSTISSNNRVFIQSSTTLAASAAGNIGIGVSNSTAGAKLHTIGNVLFGGIASTAVGARLHVVGSGTTSATTALLVQNSTPSTLFSIIDNGNTGIGLASPSASLHISGASSANLLRIDSPTSSSIVFVSGSGRVGIGTSNPTTTLDVSGSARITNQLTLSNYTNSGSFPGTGSALLAVNNSGSVITSPFLDVAEQTYTGTIAWTGTTAPSGTTNHTYRWSQVGKTVNLNIVLVYSTAGTSVSTVRTALPADCPTPYVPSGQSGAGALISVVSAHLTNTTTIGANVARGGLRINLTNNGYELTATAAATGYKVLVTSVQYFAV